MDSDDFKPIKLCHGQRPKQILDNLREKCLIGEGVKSPKLSEVVKIKLRKMFSIHLHCTILLIVVLNIDMTLFF